MYYAIIDIATGIQVVVANLVSASEALEPGTVYGTGVTTALAAQEAQERRKAALAVDWRMPEEEATALAKIETNRRRPCPTV